MEKLIELTNKIDWTGNRVLVGRMNEDGSAEMEVVLCGAGDPMDLVCEVEEILTSFGVDFCTSVFPPDLLKIKIKP